MVTQFPKANAPEEQQKWVRAVQDAVNQNERAVADAQNRTGNGASSQKGLLDRLQTQVSTLQGVVTGLQQQGDFLASLVTEAEQGSDFLIDNIPGDQTNRWYNGEGDTAVTVDVPTGRLLVNWGAGSVESRAGDSTMYAMIRVMLTAPSGWSASLGGATRTFVTGGTIMGMPFSSQRVFEGVPVDEPITARVQFGTWSAGTSSLAAAAFYTPFISAQVIPA